MTNRLSPAAVAGAFLFALAAAGCDGTKPAGTVSGKVTFNGQPLTMGSVNFLSSTGAAGMGLLDDTGSYKIEGSLAAGEYQVYLNPPVPGQFAPGSKAPPPAAKYPVPPKLQQPGTSGVTATVKTGENVIPFDFKG